ncbi:MAG: (2Fe-2S)-binding protein [Bdellovibrionota bacterium]|nr:(2Fe-2S)-binding protein [Bdellovibrionota bacterium]|tara:strand:- start:1558 stop:2013 length:456 start_codon:yes stop_codon:yes gene_type:complete
MKLSINKEKREINIPGDTPSLWAIREELGDESLKFGCGKGICGACTILVDGEPTKSCVTPIEDLKDTHITTLSGLSESDQDLTSLQKNWIEENVAQCGYCQPGQIMKAYALLKSSPNPSDNEIKEWMDNICRCGTYPRIISAIRKTANAKS